MDKSNQDILQQIALLRAMKPKEKIQKKVIGGQVFARQARSLIRVDAASAPSGSGSEAIDNDSKDYVLKSKNKLVRIGAPPIQKTIPSKKPEIDSNDILKKYSMKHFTQQVSQSTIDNNTSNQDFLSSKTKLVRKAILKDGKPQAVEQGVRNNKLRKIIKSKNVKYCRHYRWGACNDANCKFVHDPTRVIACHHLLRTGSCKTQSSGCKFNHHLDEFNTPLCLYFQWDQCAIPNCLYRHEKQNMDLFVCSTFAHERYCPLGSQCPKRHLVICPDFESSSTCPRGEACNLKHIKTKSADKVIAQQVMNSEPIPSYMDQLQSDDDSESSDDIQVYD